MRPLLRAIPALYLVASSVFAQPAQSQAQASERRNKFIRVEVGYSPNHGGSDTGISGGVHFGLSGPHTGPFRFEGGLIAGHPYLGLDVGTEVRLPQRTPVGLVLRGGVGLLIEDGFTGLYARGGGGVEWELSPRIALRGTWQAGYHGDAGGPHLMHVGIDYRW